MLGQPIKLPWAEPEKVNAGRMTVFGRARNAGRYGGNGREWATPPEVIGPLENEFHFTLDPCCTAETAKAPRFFTEADDGLAQPWAPERVFMNPPYGREIPKWTQKALSEAQFGALVVGLLPAATDLEWWHRDVLGANAEIRFVRGRIRFLAGGRRWANAFTPSVVVVWRPA